MAVTPVEFKKAFDAAFIANRKHLLWNSSTQRTALMIAYIYRTIADRFPGLKIKYEHENIDAVLYRDNLSNIEVAIEHENDVQTIRTELTNFARHNYPLNVLITYTGGRARYLNQMHGALMSSIAGELMLILNREEPLCIRISNAIFATVLGGCSHGRPDTTPPQPRGPGGAGAAAR